MTTARPWGEYKVLASSGDFQIKIIRVDINHRLSLQSHQFRSEHWFILSGQAEIEVDGKISILSNPESIFIPVGAKHRVRSIGASILEFIEIQTGSSFSEEDIVRYEDDYGRKQPT